MNSRDSSKPSAAADRRLATQPDHPLENTLGLVACTPEDAEYEDPIRTDPPVVWLGAGEQVGYLPALAANALGWS